MPDAIHSGCAQIERQWFLKHCELRNCQRRRSVTFASTFVQVSLFDRISSAQECDSDDWTLLSRCKSTASNEPLLYRLSSLQWDHCDRLIRLQARPSRPLKIDCDQWGIPNL